MDISIVIPTHRRPEKLAACLSALACQTLAPARYEVLIGLDGADPQSEVAAQAAWTTDASLHVQECPKIGLAAVRNALLPRAQGRILLSINDDVLAEPGFLEAHVAAHDEAARHDINQGRGVIISGSSPWVVHQPDRVFDRLIRETSMVFFYNRMDQSSSVSESTTASLEHWHNWGFRHAWGLNMSMPIALVRELGGFVVLPAKYGYEDNEIAYRLASQFGCPVLYRPEAIAHHDHRMEPREYFEREYKLGYAAWGFARGCRECAGAMFRRDISSPEELADACAFVETDIDTARQSAAIVESTAGQSAASATAARIADLYDQHLPAKRWCWKRGLLDAATGSPLNSHTIDPLLAQPLPNLAPQRLENVSIPR